MTRPACRPTACVPGLLLLAAALVASARPAEAGCRVADPPPTLGLSLDRLFEPTTTYIVPQAPAEASQVAPSPCRDEMPATSMTATIPAPTALGLAAGQPDHRPSPGLVLAEEDTARPPSRVDRLDRPPRMGIT